MTLAEIILTVLIQSLFCLGWRVVISEGQILYFIRKPFEFEKDSKINNYYRNKLRQYVLQSDENVYAMRKECIEKSRVMSIWLKPFILCVICFSSVWGGAVFVAMHGFLPIQLIVCCISTAFILKIVNDKVDW